MKYSIILSNLGSCADRFMPAGYSPAVTLDALFNRLESLQGISGIELVGGWHLSEQNMDAIFKYVERLHLPVIAVIPDHFGSSCWGKGAFCSPDALTRAKAVEEAMTMARYAKQLGCKLISIWNGQDGYDYPMQVNYPDAHRWLVDGLANVAAELPGMKISLEYKPKEPRNHCFISNFWSALTIAYETKLENVGVTIDTGHAFEAYENLSEVVCAAISRGRLFHMHINDNYRLWDDDMMTGSVHTIEYVELFYWLIKLGYDGYISIDQYPYREDALQAAQESINWMKAFERAAQRIDSAKMDEILGKQDSIASTRYLRELIFD